MAAFADFYARRRNQRLAQVIIDLFMVAWIILWAILGRATARTIDSIVGPVRSSREAARGLADDLRQAGDQINQIPAVGTELSRSLDEAAESVQTVIDAAEGQIASVERTALLLGWLVFVIPVVILLLIWLPARVRFLLRARAAQRFLDAEADLDLFALRAMVAQPLHVIAEISDDPVAAWRRGDREVIHALAAIELLRSGLHPPSL